MVDIGEQPHHLDRIRKGYRVLVEDAKPGSPDIAELKAIAAVLL